MKPQSRLSQLWQMLPGGVRTVLTVVLMLTALDFFFVAMKLLSAFKALGSGYGHHLIVELASNPFVGLLVGLLVTSVVQSSSSTTSLVVGLVAAGTLGADPTESVRIAVPIIMGANIGTSVTNILVSFGHVVDRQEFARALAAATVHDFFNLLAVVALLPVQVATNFLGRMSLSLAESLDASGGLAFASPLKLLVSPQAKAVKALTAEPIAASFIVMTGLAAACFFMVRVIARRSATNRPVGGLTLLFSVGAGGVGTAALRIPGMLESSELASLFLALTALFGSLYAMVRLMRGVVMSRVERLFHGYVFKTAVRAFGLGMLFTALVQSSSVTTSLIVPLAGAGFVQLHQVFPYTLGANIGTTVTAFLAALSLGHPSAVAVAAAHFLFNACGTLIWYPLRSVPIGMARNFAGACSRWPPLAAIFVVTLFFLLPLSLIFVAR